MLVDLFKSNQMEYYTIIVMIAIAIILTSLVYNVYRYAKAVFS